MEETKIIVLTFLLFSVITLLLVILHESLHFLTAYLLNLSPEIKFNFCCPSIKYQNQESNFKNLLVSALSPIIIIGLGVILKDYSIYGFYTKVLCFSNIINLFPVASDGEVILISIIRLVKKI